MKKQFLYLLLLGLLCSIGNVWADETTTWSCGFENGESAWGGSNTSNRAVNETAKRSGTKGHYATASSGSGRRINSGNMSVVKNNYYYAICWIRLSVAGKAGIGIGGAGGNDYDVTADTWTRIYIQYKAGSNTTKTICPTCSIGSNCTMYVDDVVWYKASGNVDVDLTAPSSATSPSASASSISWTNGSDTGTGATGIQKTLIWKRTSGEANDLTINSQGVYAVNSTDQSGHWTLVTDTISSTSTSFAGTFIIGDNYAIVHRDLAYNYSSPTYVTVAAATAPTITTQPSSATYFKTETPSKLSVVALTSSGDLSYQWYSCADAEKSTPSAITGEESDEYTPSTTAAGTFYYFCRVTDDNGTTDSNVATITVNNPSAPTITFDNGEYTVDGPALDVSTLFDSNSNGAVTYTVVNQNGTGAAIAGSTFTATTAGTATIRASQAATLAYTAAYEDATITVNAPDVTAPAFVSSTPANEATDVAVSGTISLTFDENVNSVDATKFSLSAGTKGEVSIDGSDAKIVKVAYSAMPNNTNITLSVAAGAVSDASGNSSAALSNITFKTVKAKLAKPTIVGTSFFKSSVHVTITSIEGATITYSTDGSSYSAYPTEGLDLTADATVYAKATHSDYLASDASNKKFKKFSSLVESAESISAATTWDWSENGQTVQLKDDGTTFPYKGESGDIVASNFNGSIFSGNASWESGFNASALVFEAVEYPTRSTYYQGQKVKFTTTVPGTVQVWYSNTGTKEVARYVDINDTEYGNADGGAGSKNQTIIPTPPVFIQAGLITITGVENHVATYVHIQKIVFTPMPATISGTITAEGWTTFSSCYPLDLNTISTGYKAYVATSVGGGEVTLTPCTDKVEANTGLMIKGTANNEFTISTTADDATFSGSNLLRGAATGANLTSSSNAYVLGKQGEPAVLGFYHVNSNLTVPAGKAYLVYNGSLSAPSVIRIVDEENNATNLSNIGATDEAVKFIQDGKFYIKRNGVTYDAMGHAIR